MLSLQRVKNMTLSVNISENIEDSNIVGTENCDIDFDFSSFDFPNQEALLEPLMWEDYLKLIFHILVVIVALIGNVGVILTVILNRAMRTTINFYLVNLAVADLLICCCCMWVPLVNSITQPLYLLGNFICKLNPFAQMTCLTSSVLTLAAIACDRFIAIIFPLHVRVTKQRTSIVITTIWSLSVAVAMPFLFVQNYVIFQWKDIAEASCYEDWPRVEKWDDIFQVCIRRYPLRQIYYTFVTTVLFFIPVTIMVTAYILIIGRLWRTEAPGERSISNINVQHRAKKKVIKMVCVVLFGFIVCWSPLQITVLYSQFGHSASQSGELPHWFEWFSYFSMFLAYFNSALNPMLYGGFNNNFRQGLCKVLKCAYFHPFERFQRSQKSRTTHNTGLTGSPSSGRLNEANSVRQIEMKQFKKEAFKNQKCSGSYSTSLEK